jgi:DNA repair exonuclease SbcCD nuclease subunit
MYIIHTADLHLESSLETNLDPIKAQSRKKELISNCARLLEYAQENNCSKIIIAGDLFDDTKISSRTKNHMLDLINSNNNIDFFYICGNHDEEFILKENNNLPSNLYLFGNDFKTYHFDNLDITGINYHSSYDFNKLILNPEKINILIMHGDIDKEIKLADLKNKSIDYLALGHIHKFSMGKIDDRGVYAYPGTLEGRGYDEAGEKGFIKLNVTDNIKTEFVPFALRTIHEINFDISKFETYHEIRRNLDLKIADISENDILSINLVGNYSLDMVKQNEILTEFLNDRFYFARINDLSTLKINPKDYENDISLKGEFIRNVLASKLKEEDKNRVIEYGIKALLKEEFE